jgi:hypothetical protein
MTCNITVTKNANPHPMETNLSRVLSIRILLEYSCDKSRSPEVMRSIIAIAASHILRSGSVSGMFISITITCCLKIKSKVDSYTSILL